MTQRPNVLIIGGGFGGLEAAKGFNRAPVDVTLLDRNNHHLFQPLLYQVASAGLSPADIAIPIRSVLGRQKNLSVAMAEVSALHLHEQRVETSDGAQFAYDKLVIAAGAETNYFGNDHWGEHAISLKSIEDAVDMRRKVLLAFERAERTKDPELRRRLLTFVVIGAGPTGVELAGALSELNRRVLAADYRSIKAEDTRVILVEMADRVLPPFHPSLSASALEQLRQLEVEVRLGHPVKDIAAGKVVLPEEVIETETVLWTSGVKPVPLAQQVGDFGAPLVKGRIHVNQDCTVPGFPDVYAIGDISFFEGPEGPLPGVSPVAMQQGRYVARHILSTLDGKTPKPFVYRDKGMMATIGRSRAVADAGGIRLTGFFAWLAWLAVHLWFLVGFKNRVSVLLSWIFQYVMFRRGARLITRPDSVRNPPHERLMTDQPEPDQLRAVGH
ncbi:MAG: NAD(P)/FAD-dependent oxidoreductase [Myxococcota bacterium]